MTARQTRARVDDDIRTAPHRLLSLPGRREMCCSRDLARGFSLLTSAWLPVTAPSRRRRRTWMPAETPAGCTPARCVCVCVLASLFAWRQSASLLFKLSRCPPAPRVKALRRPRKKHLSLCSPLLDLARAGSTPGLCESLKPPPEQAPYGQPSCWFCRLTDVPPRAPSAWWRRCGHGGPHQPQPGGV